MPNGPEICDFCTQLLAHAEHDVAGLPIISEEVRVMGVGCMHWFSCPLRARTELIECP
jgi:hypothetical protein